MLFVLPYEIARRTTTATRARSEAIIIQEGNNYWYPYRYSTGRSMVVILTTDEILRKGLELVGFDCRRQQNVSWPKNLERFRAHYGSDPVVYSQIWEDLQVTEIPAAQI
jgi:hypothetical protein